MISLHDVHQKYRRSAFSLDVNSLELTSGGIVAVLGRNGSGKSTLLSLLAGLQKPLKGGVRYEQRNVFQHYEQIKSQVHLLSWNVALFETLSPEDHIRLVQSTSRNWDLDLAERLLADLKIPMGQKVGELSKGEHAKLKLLLSLAAKPRVVLIDEITNDLDTETRRAMYRELDDYSFREGALVVIATNIVSDMERYASRIVLLHKGVVLLNEDVDHLKETHKRIALRMDDATAPADPSQLYNLRLEWDGRQGQLLTDRFKEETLTSISRLGIEASLMPLELDEIVALYEEKREKGDSL